MIFAFIIGFLLGALIINMYLKDEENENEKLRQKIIELQEEVDRLNYLNKIKYRKGE